MDAPSVRKATILALALTLERVFDAVVDNDDARALEHALLVEYGASLLAASLAADLELTPERLDEMRDKLRALVSDATPASREAFTALIDENFLRQRDNADLN